MLPAAPVDFGRRPAAGGLCQLSERLARQWPAPLVRGRRYYPAVDRLPAVHWRWMRPEDPTGSAEFDS